MNHLLLVAVGGAIGAMMRFMTANIVYNVLQKDDLPYATLLINVSGSFVMGVLYVLIIEKMVMSAEWRLFLMVGLLGSFTTLATLSVETFELIELGEWLKAFLNMFLNVAGSLGAVIIGIWLARQW